MVHPIDRDRSLPELEPPRQARRAGRIDSGPAAWEVEVAYTWATGKVVSNPACSHGAFPSARFNGDGRLNTVCEPLRRGVFAGRRRGS